MNNYPYGYGDPWSGLIHIAGDILIIAIVVWLFMWMFGGRRHGRHGMMHGPGMWHTHDAIGILNERYAKGEINKEEYEERKKTLLT